MEPPVASRADLSRRIAVETPENVILEFELAGLGSRAAATVVDTAIVVSVLLVVAFGTGWFGLLESASGTWLAAVAVAATFAAFWGYFVLFEAVGGGRTPGKRAMGIRVVMETGHAVTFGAAATRNLLRLVDGQPGLTYLLGGLFVFFDSRHRRLGDLVAGTIVVRDRPEEQQLAATAHQAAAAPGKEAAGAAATHGSPELSDHEFHFLEQYLARRDTLAFEARERLGGELVGLLAPRYPRRPRGDVMFLRWLYERESGQRRGVTVHRTPGPAAGRARSAGAERFVATKQGGWDEFRRAATQAERGGLKNMPGAEIPRFAAAYREVAADLARARTYGADARVLGYLERLVSAGHNALYGLRGVRRPPLRRLLLGEIPGAVIQARGYVLTAFLVFALPAIAGYALIRERPATAAEVLPDELIARAEAGPSRREEGVGYAEAPSVYLPMITSQIVTNNIQVAFGAFAFGAAAGVGTLVVLIFNGLFFGAVLGHFANEGVAAWLLTFVAAHGVLELPAIFIAGGAGLLIGRAIVAPGNLSRGDALVVNGRLAIRLVAAAACLLLVAGFIEGFLSVSDAPTALKLATSGAGIVLLALYLLAGWAHVRGEVRRAGANRTAA